MMDGRVEAIKVALLKHGLGNKVWTGGGGGWVGGEGLCQPQE